MAPGLALDASGDTGFVAVACVQTRRLRPAPFPAVLGRDFMLVGYRVFVRYTTRNGQRLRGLQVLGSETDRRSMALLGKLLTHYGYRYSQMQMQVRRDEETLHVESDSGVDVRAGLGRDELPPGSVFASWSEARRFAGPMPFTFASEDGGRAVLRVEGVRAGWSPRPVAIEHAEVPFFSRELGIQPAPASAFLVEDVDYRWKRGVRERLVHR